MVLEVKTIIWNIFFFAESIVKRLFAKSYTKKIVENAEKRINSDSILNQDKTYYVIRREGEGGFFSNYFFVLGHSIIAEEHGWIPIVDMKYYKTPYNEDNVVKGTQNAWEYYFASDCETSLDDAIQSRNVLYSCFEYPFEKVPYYSIGIGRYPNKGLVEKLGPYVERYCKIRPDLQAKFEKESEKYNLSQCIGVHIRGTDMKTASAHPTPPTLQKVMKKIDDIIKKYGEDYMIFLCTDEIYIENEMRKKYGKKLQIAEAYRSTDGKKGIHLESAKNNIRENHHYLLGEEVLRDAFFLSKCRMLIAGKSNVPYAAIVMNGNKYLRIIHQ